MSITCDIRYLNEQEDYEPFQGLHIILRCLDRHSEHFEAYTDDTGVITEWYAINDWSSQPLPATAIADTNWLMILDTGAFYQTPFPLI
jgi:hypothetical protein